MIPRQDEARLTRILAILQERKGKERLRGWVPTVSPHNDQKGFLESPAKIRAIFGGNRSGKTEAVCVDTALLCMGEHPTRSKSRPPPVMGRFLAPSYEDGLKAIILSKYMELIPFHQLKGNSWEKAWSEKHRAIYFKNGSKIRFFSYEQDINKMGGADLDFVALDEHCPEAVFNEHLMRIVDRDGYIVMAMTPEAGITWELDRVVEAAEKGNDIAYWFFSTYNNPHLSRKGIEFVERQITDERLRKTKLHGEFVALSGLVYPQWNPDIHVIPQTDPPEDAFCMFCIDAHRKKPSVMLWAFWTGDKELIVYDEAEFAPGEGGIEQLKALIRVKSSGRRIQRWIGDEAQGGEGLDITGQKSVMSQLASGVDPIPIQGTSQKSEELFNAGIFKMREMLTPDPVDNKPKFFVMANCEKTAKEFRMYRFRRETKTDEETLREHIRNVDDDRVTCARYMVMLEPNIGFVGVTSALNEADW